MRDFVVGSGGAAVFVNYTPSPESRYPVAINEAYATQHGGQEVTLFSIITNLMHFGMIIVGLPYSHQGMMTLDEIVGGSPYGASTIAGGDGSRQPSGVKSHCVHLIV